MSEEVLNQSELKKKFLNEYKGICKKQKSLEEQKESLIETMVVAKTQKYDGLPKANKKRDISDDIVRLEKLKEEIYQKSCECLAKKIAIESAIVRMNNGFECDILRKRYLQFKEWITICEETGYSWSQVHRTHGSALKNFVIPKKE